MAKALSVGSMDVFERIYTGKFRDFAAAFGEFVTYERDRAARDIGLHLTRRTSSEDETVTSSLCWFQLKGITAKRASAKSLKGADSISIKLSTDHLLFWYQQPTPTYLVVYIEAIDRFVTLNIQKYVAKTWGKSILREKRKTVAVPVSLESELDDQAFELMLRHGEASAWRKLFNLKPKEIRLAQRDFELIHRIAEAKAQGEEVTLEYIDWISKTRSEMKFYVVPKSRSEKPQLFRDHWQSMTTIRELEDDYPYLDFAPATAEDDAEYDDDWDEYEEYQYTVELARSGCTLRGSEFMGEYVRYSASVIFNRLGRKLAVSIKQLIGARLVDPAGPHWISVAPWHRRDI